MASDTNGPLFRRDERHAIAVVTNKSWYEGFVPLFVYFAQRACPYADVLVFFMGPIDGSVKRALKASHCNPERYKLIGNYALNYGTKAIAAKMARWTIPLHPAVDGYKYLYIGDVDLLLAREESPDLFEQHIAHSSQLGVPISNIVRTNSTRLSGLHFVQLKEYCAKADIPMKKLRRFLIDNAASGDVAVRYPDPGGDEKALYDIVALSDKTWIDSLRGTTFRPHHGVHLGLFRNSGRVGNLAVEARNDPHSDLPKYWADVAPVLADGMNTEIWAEIFKTFPRVETACRQFLEFYNEHNLEHRS